MLKRRVMPVLLMREGSLVKGEKYNSWRRVGSILPAVKVFEARQVDEIVLLDIAATPEGRDPDIETIRSISSEVFTPLTVGGGIRNIKTIEALLRAGADKVSICTAAVENPQLIKDAANRFGSQCVTVSIDVKDGRVATNCGSISSVIDPVTWACCVQSMGAGEILLGSVDRDGTLLGYDLSLIEEVSRAVQIPVVASGGARDYRDFQSALEVGAHAVAASALFQFTDATPLGAKKHLSEKGVPVRL